MWRKEICPYYLVWVRGASPRVSLTLFTAPLTHTFFMNMSMNINNFGGTINYNDHHKEFTISGASTNVSEIVRSFFSEDITPVQEVEPSEREYCIYICREKLEEQGIYSLDEFEKMFANATKGTAPELAGFLKRYKAQGTLDFMGHTKRQIFDNIRAHYVEMREYDYPNFAAAY